MCLTLNSEIEVWGIQLSTNLFYQRIEELSKQMESKETAIDLTLRNKSMGN